MKGLVLWVSLLCFFNAHLFAIEQAFVLTDLGSSAESISVGGVYGSSLSAQSVFENPALLGTDYSVSLDVFQTTVMDDFSIRAISGSKVLGKYTIALGYSGTGSTGIPKTVSKNQEFVLDGDYGYTQVNYYFGVQRQWMESLTAGVVYVRTSRELASVSGTGNNLNVGVSYRHALGRVSIAGTHILTDQRIDYSNGAQELFPSQVHVTFSSRWRAFEPMAQYSFIQKSSNLMSFGLRWLPKFLPGLDLMTGYRQFQDLDETKGRWTVGLGLNLQYCRLGYAYERSPIALLDNGHYFSISIKE